MPLVLKECMAGTSGGPVEVWGVGGQVVDGIWQGVRRGGVGESGQQMGWPACGTRTCALNVEFWKTQVCNCTLNCASPPSDRLLSMLLGFISFYSWRMARAPALSQRSVGTAELLESMAWG